MSGLMEQIKAVPHPMTVDLTPESLKQALIDFAILDTHEKREFVVITGQRGHEMLADSIYRKAYRTMLADDKDKYSEKEYTRLSDMINSSDRENLQLAKIIIKQKM